MRKKILRIILITIFLSGILGGIIGAGLIQSDKAINTKSGQRFVVSEESALTQVAQEASESVVSIIDNTLTNNSPFPIEGEEIIGSGFIIAPNGIIVTNAHVVDNPEGNYSVVTKGGKTIAVDKINRDSESDLAILFVSADNLPTAKLGNSDTLRQGQTVIAIGTVLGTLDNSVTVGVISAMDRGVTASDPGGANAETLEGVIQVDAALNPGSSGGPLLDLSGEVVGINFAVTEGAENIGFAIPINKVKQKITTLSEGKII